MLRLSDILVSPNVLVLLPWSKVWHCWSKAKAICWKLAPDQHKREETSPREWNAVLCSASHSRYTRPTLWPRFISRPVLLATLYRPCVQTLSELRGLSGTFYISGQIKNCQRIETKLEVSSVGSFERLVILTELFFGFSQSRAGKSSTQLKRKSFFVQKLSDVTLPSR